MNMSCKLRLSLALRRGYKNIYMFAKEISKKNKNRFISEWISIEIEYHVS